MTAADRTRSIDLHAGVPAAGVQTGEQVFPAAGPDALPPPEIARRAADLGVRKADLPVSTLVVLAVLAGAFIGMGAVFATTAMAGGADLPFGVQRLLGGVAFSLGLILVVVAGAELFTGNNLLVMAWASRLLTTRRLLAGWAIVYLGNFAGALATAALMYLTRQYTFGDGAVGREALAIAAAKVELGFVQAIALGAFCNALVCLAVWLTYAARSVTDKILAVIPPIAAFVAAGFEHSVANMYFVPVALLIRRDSEWAAGASTADTEGVTWSAFLLDNLLPVTIGNVVGGALMVGAVYWFVYLRTSPPAGALGGRP